MWRPIGGRRCMVFVYTLMLLGQSLVLIGTRIHGIALALLAVGLATVAARLAERFAGRFDRLLVSTALPLALVVALVAVGVPIRAAWRQWSALAALPPPPANAPNVILVTLDTVRVQNLSLYGYGRPTTPELERIAQRGIMFHRAMTPSPWTLPTHASLFTGRLPHEHRADASTQWLDKTYPTLGEVLQSRGYVTAGFVGNMLACGRVTGVDRGFIHYHDVPVSLNMLAHGSLLWEWTIGMHRPFPRKTAEAVNEEFLTWLDQHGQRPSRPFFAFLNYFDAHDPYWVPDPEFDLFSPLPAEERERIRRKRKSLWNDDPVELQWAVDTYDGAIAYLDHHLGRLIDELDARGILDNTVVIITSDHGEHFGERKLFGHGCSLYRQLIDAPLLVLVPGDTPANATVTTPVSLVDVPATILELVDGNATDALPGRSLAPLWREGEADETYRETPLIAELEQSGRIPTPLNRKGPIFSLLIGDLHYIRYTAPLREEIFDYERDPLQTTDLIDTPRAQQQLPELRRAMYELITAAAANGFEARPVDDRPLPWRRRR